MSRLRRMALLPLIGWGLPVAGLALEDHSGHVMPAVALPATVAPAEDHSQHGQALEVEPPAVPVEDHSGHAPASPAPAPGGPLRNAPADPHAGHRGHGRHPVVVPAAPLPGPVLPAPDPERLRAAFPEFVPHAHMQASPWAKVVLDRLEAQEAGDDTALAWEGRASWGREFDRLALTSEGERLHGDTEELRHELFWSHAFSRWWESRLGLRRDDGEGPARNWVGVGVEGLAPMFIEVSAVAYVGESGRTAFTLEAEYEARLTNRLILQPRLELNAHGEDDAQKGIASGLSDTSLGLRLRYEIRRELAPYAGVEWNRLHGDSARLARRAGEREGEARLVAGLRIWF